MKPTHKLSNKSMKSRDNQGTQQSPPIINIIALGKLDWTWKLNITNEEVEKYKIDITKLNDLNEIMLQIVDKDKLIDKIEVTSEDEYLNSLLFIAKSSKNEKIIDFIPIKGMDVGEDQTLLRGIVKHVTKSKGWYINDFDLVSTYNYRISFTVMINNILREFHYGTNNEDARRSGKNGEVNSQGDGTGETGKEQSDSNNANNNSNRENEGNDENKQPHQYGNSPNSATNKGDSPFDNLQFRCLKYDIMYINFDMIIDFPSDKFKIEDYIDLVDYWREESCLIVNKFNASARRVNMKTLNTIFSKTDLMIFNYKECAQLFDLHYKEFSIERPFKAIENKKVFDYFTQGIASSCGWSTGNKIGWFIDDFTQFTVIEVNGKYQSKTAHDCQPYPKINHGTIKKASDYKQIIKNNYSLFESIFYGGFLGKLIDLGGKPKGQKVLYPAFLVGLELVKRWLEWLKNKIPFIEDERLYKVNIPQSTIDEYFNKNILSKKEGNFVLDCTNKSKSALKEYMPWYDYNWSSFLSCDIIRKDLKNKGFINSRGFIMYDAVYRNVLGPQCKHLKAKNLPRSPDRQGDAMKDKQLVNIIKQMKITENIQLKEVNSKDYLIKNNITTVKKIPNIIEAGLAGHTKNSTIKTTKKLSKSKGKDNRGNERIVEDEKENEECNNDENNEK